MDNLAARHQMVDQQIRTWEVLDPRVLAALTAVPREAFVPRTAESWHRWRILSHAVADAADGHTNIFRV